MRPARVRCGLLLLAAFCALAGFAAPAEAAETAAKLAKACIDERPDSLASAARKLFEADRAALEEQAEKWPRAYQLPALIALRQGDLAAARSWYDRLLERLPEESAAAEIYGAARSMLDQQIALAQTSDSRYARAGYSYVGSLSGIEGPGGRSYALATWRKSPCGWEVPGNEDEARVELFEAVTTSRLVRRDEIAPAEGLIEPDAVLVQGPEAAPMASLHVYTGGDCLDCGYRRVFRIDDGALQEITLPRDSSGPIHRAEDLDGDGIPELLSLDGRWQSYRGLCTDCSPSVASIYRLEGDETREACRDFDAYYQGEIAEAETQLSSETAFKFRARWAVGAYLGFIQMGDFDAARQFLNKQLSAPGRGYSYEEARRADEMVIDLQRQLTRVERLMARPCSALDMTAGS